MIPENKAKIVSVIKRYRDETPLGHQPHMLAHLADEALAIMEAELANPDAQDAARYRWLRDFHIGGVNEEFPFIHAGDGYVCAWAHTGKAADAAIDAAMDQSK